jgi:hypothetical protein
MPELYLDGNSIGWVVGSISLEMTLAERSIFQFVYLDELENTNVQKGMQVYFYAPNASGTEILQFAGFIEDFVEQGVTTKSGSGIFYDIECADWNSYSDRKSTQGIFEDKTAGSIINDLAYNYIYDDNIYTHPYPGTAVTIARTDMSGYWRLNTNARDSGWQDRHGSETGSPEYTAENSRLFADYTVPGSSPINDVETGGHVDLNGSEWITTSLTGLQLDGEIQAGGGLSVFLWVYITSGVTSTEIACGLASADGTSNGANSLFIISRDSSESGSSLRATVWKSNGNSVSLSGPALPDETWVQVGFVADNDEETLRFYVQGVEVDSADMAGGVVQGNCHGSRFEIGSVGSATSGWNGQLTECLVTARAVGATDAALLYLKASSGNLVASGANVTRFVANYTPMSFTLEYLAEMNSYDFYVDPYRTLHFHGRGSGCCLTPFSITGENILASNVVRKSKDHKYRNRQAIIGGKDNTNSQTEVLIATQDDQPAFSVGYRIREKPLVELSTNSGATYVTQNTGPKSEPEAHDFHYEKGSEVLRPDHATISQGDYVRVTYKGEFDLVVIASDSAEIEALQKVEKSGSSVVDAVLNDTSIASRVQGFEVAGGRLDRYAVRSSVFQFTTRIAGLRPGQTGTINVPRHSLVSEPAIIESVSILDQQGIELRYQVQMATGAILKSWEAFFGSQVVLTQKAGERDNQNEQEVVTLLAPVSEVTSWTESSTTYSVEVCTIFGATLGAGFILC